jgi:predicted outer membrane repeat protein
MRNEQLAMNHGQRKPRGAGRSLALLVTVCLLVAMGCADLFLDKPGDGGGAGASGDMPEGHGAVSIRLTSGAARTAAPGNVLDNLRLSYVFARLVEGSRPGMWVPEGPGEEMTPDEDGIVVLEAGRYRLMVNAYLDEARENLVAEGVPDKEYFDINAGDKVDVEVYLRPAASGGGMGELVFTLEYPSGAAVDTLTLTLMPDGDLIDLLTEATELTPSATGSSGTKNDIAAGYYLLQVVVANSDGAAGRTEVAHIYQGRTTQAAYHFGNEDFQAYSVTSAADDGPGTLRWAIEKAQEMGGAHIQALLEPGAVIELKSALEIEKSLTIEGNGATLTRAESWTVADNTQLLRITGYGTEVEIRRVHFKNGRTTNDGGAIYSNLGKLTLESCIFNGNQASRGGAVYSNNDLAFRGCTFYGNSAEYYGGAVFFDSNFINTLTLTGNLFYGNSAGTYPVVRNEGGTVTTSYNVVDVDFGIGAGQAGFTNEVNNKNKKIDGLPVSPVSFRLLEGSGAKDLVNLGVVAGNYPTEDFYGNSISGTGNGAAGAAQATAAGWYLELSVNDKARGSVAAEPEPDEDGLYQTGAAISITAQPNDGHALGRWLVDNEQKSKPPATITNHTFVEAVFGRKVEVSSTGDGNVEGTLRYALANAEAGDVIVLSGVEPGKTSIELGSPLPDITKSLTIEGNGVTLATKTGWVADNYTPLLGNAAADVLIRRVHFKNGRSGANGGAVHNTGKLTLESCIFSGNQAMYTGGAVFSMNADLTIRGCTFYGNSSNEGGAVLFNGNAKTLTLTGNLFYGNSAGTYPVVRNNNGYVTAAYNVVDVELGEGTDQAGWDRGNGDKTFAELGIEGDPFDTTTFAPVAGLEITPSRPDFPATDFYGNERTFPAAAGAVR